IPGPGLFPEVHHGVKGYGWTGEVLAGPLEKGRGRPVVRMVLEERLERHPGLREVLVPPQAQRILIAAGCIPLRLAGLPGQGEQFVDDHRLALAGDADRIELADLDPVTGQLPGALTDHDERAVMLVRALQ